MRLSDRVALASGLSCSAEPSLEDMVANTTNPTVRDAPQRAAVNQRTRYL
jgi:hypothetical protein